MDQSVKIWNKHAKGYAKKPIADEATYQKKLQITQEYLKKDMNLLEIGCGTGSTAIAHAPHVKYIRAIDFSSNMIEIAQDKIDAKNIKNISFELSTINEFNAPDCSMDVVLGLSILHLLEDKEVVIAKVHKMLKPGGIFVTSTLCLGESKSLFFKVLTSIGNCLGLMPTIKVFSTKELKDSIIDAEFDIDYYWHPGKGKAVFIVARKR